MRRWVSAMAVGAVVVPALGVASLATPAAAEEAWESLATISADPRPTWQTNGVAWTVETVGDVVYVGGSFTKVRPPGVATGGAGEVERLNFAAFDAVTGDLLPCAPSFTLSSGTAWVRTLEGSPDGSRLYVGGSFGRVSTVGVSNMVALDTATCALVPTSSFRRPGVNGVVRAISATPDRVYLAGEFSQVDGQARPKFAAVTSAGALTATTTNFNGNIRALIAAPEVGKVIAGGYFTTANGTASRGLVAVHPDTGAVVQTYPGWIPDRSVVHVLTRDGDRFYVGAEGSGSGVFDGRIGAVLSTGEMV